MNSKVSEYLIRQISASGFALVDHVIVRKLTHDLIWASARDCLGDFTQARRKMREFLGTLGVSILEVKFASQDHWLLVGTRSTDRLAERINWITGLVVEGLRPFSPVPPATVQRGAAVKDEPPEHFCAARTEWFAERNLIDPKIPKKTAPIPFSGFAKKAQR